MPTELEMALRSMDVYASERPELSKIVSSG